MDTSPLEYEVCPYSMERKHTNSAVNRAGDFIAGRNDCWKPLLNNPKEWEKRFDEAFDIMADWRSLHAVPMKLVSNILSSEATSIDGSPIVVERLKRFKSIRLKLQRFSVTNLTTIQDIAGCRAVVRDVAHAYKLSDLIVTRLKSNLVGPGIVENWFRDYIANPKPDGYRSIHQVAKFHRSDDPDLSPWKDLRVEIQIRSKIQHAWAMAVETASAITNQALKSGEGHEAWMRFFFLVAEIVAFNEGNPSTFSSESEHRDARIEAADLEHRLRVVPLLSTMQHVLENYSTFEGRGGDDLYLLELNSEKREIKYVGYAKQDFKKASEAYAEKERENKNKEDIHVVLVSAESLEDLKSAYPSFFLDSAGFIELIRDQVFGA
jgi:ppGpp synthetase/RelA/SpoT-type nucleotidyltranferase